MLRRPVPELSQANLTTPDATAPNWTQRDFWVAAGLLVLAVAVRAITYGNSALGFDEQFYLLVGERMLQGELPFVDIFDRKPIGIFLIYAGAQLFGGDGFVAYKLVALIFVIATAWLIYAMARHRSGRVGATLAAVFYMLWLNFMEGEGGQTPVFYNLLMLGAAALLFAAVRTPARLWRHGIAALLLVGLAIQIKYTVVFEGVFLGVAFLWLAWRHQMPWARWIGFGAAMVVAALVPTLLVMAVYAWIGQFDAFFFANFLSIFGQGKGAANQFVKLGEVSAIFLPFGIIALFGHRALRRETLGIERLLLRLWLVVAVGAVVVYWRFNSPHYALPILPPLCLLLAPALDLRRRLGIALAGIALVVGQLVQMHLITLKGGDAQMRAVAAAARPDRGCIFIYNGYPGLYMMTGSCLPSRWAFPGHVNAQDENYPAALGVDPVAETARILAGRPDAIIDTFPVFKFGNVAARAQVYQTIAREYDPVLCVKIGRGGVRVVYRRKDDPFPRMLDDCPAYVFAAIANRSE